MIDFHAAGQVLNDQIRRRFFSPGDWLKTFAKPPCSESTIRHIVDGSYNGNQGPTLDMLWRICMALAEDDTSAAQALMLAYLCAGKMVPVESTMLVHVDLVRAEVHLKRARQALEKLARKRQIEVVEPNGHEA